MSSNSALIKDSQRPIELLGHQVFEISTTKNFAFQYSLWNKKKKLIQMMRKYLWNDSHKFEKNHYL